MVELASPIGTARRSGRHGNVASGIGVTLSEPRRGSIVEVAAWPATTNAVLAAIAGATGLALQASPAGGATQGTRTGFCIGPGRYLLADEAPGLAGILAETVGTDIGSVTDLSHGRTMIHVDGPKVEWVLAKLFAIDFATPAFPVGTGIATAHHDILAQIPRVGPQAFDICVFRSFARSFWTALCHAAAETGYEVA